jgi:hypothetical protein
LSTNVCRLLRKLILCCLIAFMFSFAEGQSPQHQPAPKRIVGLEYPWFGRVAGIEGTVEIVALISPDGTVKSFGTASGPEPLVNSAKGALSKWLFEKDCSTATGGCAAKIVFVFSLAGVCDVSQRCPTEFSVDLPDLVRLTAKHAHAIVN